MERINRKSSRLGFIRVDDSTPKDRAKLAVFYLLYIAEAVIYFATLSTWRVEWPVRWLMSDIWEEDRT